MKIRGRFGNLKTLCFSRHLHASGLEARYCNRLLAMLQRKEISGFDIQVSFPLSIGGVKICKHIVDFLVIHIDGKIEVHETKGHKTAAWSIKHKLFRVIYPNIKYILITKGGS